MKRDILIEEYTYRLILIGHTLVSIANIFNSCCIEIPITFVLALLTGFVETAGAYLKNKKRKKKHATYMLSFSFVFVNEQTLSRTPMRNF